MSPDFHIRKYLRIEHANGIAYYELYMHRDNQRGYFCDDIGTECYDSDNENKNEYGGRMQDPSKIKMWEEIYEKIINYCLTPNKELVIYQNNEFLNDVIKEKYLPIIQLKIKQKKHQPNIPYEDTGHKITDFSTITKITKFETRTQPIY